MNPTPLGSSDYNAATGAGQPPIVRRTVIHMCVSIRGVLRWKDRELAGMFRNDDGSKLTGEQVREYLLDQLQLGRKVLPMSPECTGFDYQTGCPGHEESEAAHVG